VSTAARRSAPAPSPLGAAALDCARGGWAVLPLQPGAKVPASAHGLLDATIDTATIAAWWRRSPSANIGLAVPACYLVLDCDDPEVPRRLEALGVELPATVRARTPRGQHRWYSTSREVRPRVAVVPGLDVRGVGSYVVVPPSVVGGLRYEWTVPLDRDRIAEAPGALLELLDVLAAQREAPPARPGAAGAHTAARRRGGALADPVELLARGADAGERNDRIFRACCLLRAAAWDDVSIAQFALEVAALCRPPLDRREAIRCARSASRYPPGVSA
jgi:hypothetical protein